MGITAAQSGGFAQPFHRRAFVLFCAFSQQISPAHFERGIGVILFSGLQKTVQSQFQVFGSAVSAFIGQPQEVCAPAIALQAGQLKQLVGLLTSLSSQKVFRFSAGLFTAEEWK